MAEAERRWAVMNETELREQIAAALYVSAARKLYDSPTTWQSLPDNEADEWRSEARAVMAVVRPLLAERDAAIQLAETRFSFGTAAIKDRDRAEADLAAARQQLDQVREWLQGWENEGWAAELLGILDAAPADETAVDGEAELREQVTALIVLHWGTRSALADAVMAVVQPLLAERDAAVERAKRNADLWDEAHEAFETADEQRHCAEADLAAARQQLDQVRAIAGGSILIPPPALRQILDAPPADETGGAT